MGTGCTERLCNLSVLRGIQNATGKALSILISHEVRSAWSRGLDQTSSRGPFPSNLNLYIVLICDSMASILMEKKPDWAKSSVYIFLHILSSLLRAATLTMMLKPVAIQNTCPEQDLGVFASSMSAVGCTFL